ncbi:substrate-binding domain-containing protein [Phycisphaeraceae bacterium D3-23]
MNPLLAKCWPVCAALSLVLAGCGSKTETDTSKKITWEDARDGSVTVTNPDTGVTWTIVGIMTDSMDDAKAKANAEDALTKNDDLAAMVGLWQYNPPLIHQAVSEAGMLGQVKIIGFDEAEATLDAIREGEIVGTVVQNPYAFGFRSVEMLSAIARGQDDAIDVPASGKIYVPTRVIQQDNVDDFLAELVRIKAGQGPVLEYDADAYSTDGSVSIHFVANGVNPFWDLAGYGCERAGPLFNAEVSVYQPPQGQVQEQQQYIEDIITNEADGLAVSPIDASGQNAIINRAAETMAVIACDSDAPTSDRLFYLGTDNYEAGRQAGQMIAEACPEGGKIVIFVGKLEVLNAQERSQGVIDYLLGQ